MWLVIVENLYGVWYYSKRYLFCNRWWKNNQVREGGYPFRCPPRLAPWCQVGPKGVAAGARLGGTT